MKPSTPILSVLDPSPVFAGRTARDALNETRALAEAVETLGYRAYWVQEHHNAASFAGTAPEVLMSDLASRTHTLCLGSGGIMLPNYSPLKVAEWAQTLNQLYPGRIEIGLGRATGADPRASAALLGPGGQNFPRMLEMLKDWLLDASGVTPLPAGHGAYNIAANPPGDHADLWYLCSSADSARLAGRQGLKLAFADFLNPGGGAEAIAAYREAFTPSPFCPAPHAAIGLVALAAETDAEAKALAAPMTAWAYARQTSGFTPYRERAEAQSLLDALDTELPTRGIIGSGGSVGRQLQDLATRAQVDEFFILSITDTLASRIRSYALIAEAFG